MNWELCKQLERLPLNTPPEMRVQAKEKMKVLHIFWVEF